jgi:2-polyprenyl-6-methoxyphenol hydroxylase-like FAD-dependent oxidoreductase
MTVDVTVLIIGAGPTGLALAYALTRHGVACRIVERRRQRPQTSRAVVVQPRTLEALALMGLAEEFCAAGHRIPRATLFSRFRRITRVDFFALRSRFPFLLTLPQAETESILERALARRGVTVERGTALADLAQAEATVLAQLTRDIGGSEAVRAEWMVGCDGTQSSVRYLLGIPFAGPGHSASHVLADVAIEGGLDPAEAQFHDHDDGGLALLPLPGGRWRLAAGLRLVPGAVESQRRAGDQQRPPCIGELQRMLDTRRGPGLALRELPWGATMLTHRRAVQQLRGGRVFLAGDAAHAFHPLGGYGLNTGIQDAMNLAWKLAMVSEGSAGPALLDSYGAERIAAARGSQGRLLPFALMRQPQVRALRDALLVPAGSLPIIRRTLATDISGLAITYRGSPVVRDALGRGGLRAGDRAPDADCLRAEDDRPTRLFEMLAEGRHILLLAACGPRDRIAANSPPSWSAQPGPIVQPQSVALVAAGEAYGSTPCAYLLRPDGVVALRSSPADAPSEIARYFREMLGSRTGG